MSGRPAEAQALMEEAIQRYRELDDLYYEGMAAGGLAGFKLLEGDYVGFIRWSLVGIRVSQELGDTATLMRLVIGGVLIALSLGMPEPAATLLAAYTALARRFGMVSTASAQGAAALQGYAGVFMPGWSGDPLERARDALDPESFERATRRGQSMTLDEAVELLIETSEKIVKLNPVPG